MNKTINYQTDSLEKITDYIDDVIRETAVDLSDSPISRANQINNHIGFFIGVCSARGFSWNVYDPVRGWMKLAE